MSLREPMSEDELANRIGVDMVHNFAHRCANELDGIGETSKTTYSSMLNALSDSCGLDCGVEVKNPTELYDTEYNRYKQLFDCGQADGMSGNQMFRTAVLGGATTELAVLLNLLAQNYMMPVKKLRRSQSQKMVKVESRKLVCSSHIVLWSLLESCAIMSLKMLRRLVFMNDFLNN